MSTFHLYKTEGKGKLPPVERNERINDPRLYQPSSGLVNAVNVALALGQPLLLTGEPGTGKTQLAHHLAYFFELGQPLIFNAQTTSTARDLFYRYDALGHFQYTQTQSQALSPKEVEQKFIHYQALGAAIRANERSLVLIDEIDKAPRDLPNNILAALEELRFDVPELGEQFEASAEQRPIIIMTSNSEKNLPDAFLRRVTYYHLPFPDAATLLQILISKIEGFSDQGLTSVIEHFEMIRSGNRVKLRKNPATAELIQWAALLQKLQFDTAQLEKLRTISDEERHKLLLSYSVLAKNKEDLTVLQENMLR